MKMRFYRKSARFKTGWAQLSRLVALVYCVLPTALALGEAPSNTGAAESSWRVVISAKYRLPEVTRSIPGAKTSALAAAVAATDKAGGEEVRLMDKNTFDALGLDWSVFFSKTTIAASAALAQLQPEWNRDKNQVIECAILRSLRPGDDITVAVLAPDFLKRFTPVFGRKMLLAIPDRHTVYIFPKLASHYQDYAEQVAAVYRKSNCPLSREVFELSIDGLRAIGEYEEP